MPSPLVDPPPTETTPSMARSATRLMAVSVTVTGVCITAPGEHAGTCRSEQIGDFLAQLMLLPCGQEQGALQPQPRDFVGQLGDAPDAKITRAGFTL